MPTGLRHQFPAHDVRTVRFMGRAGLKNGALLAAMEADGFEALLTADRSLWHQQNLHAAGVGVVVMVAPTSKLPDLRPLVPAVSAALWTLRPGDVVEVGGP